MDSVLSQSFTDFECLLIDDGSKDRSGEICDEYAAKDSRVRVFHKENGGVSSARNVGLDNATGEWISFVDSDDWVGKKYLESFSGHLDADLIIGSFLFVKHNEFVNDKSSEYLPEGYYLDFTSFVKSHLCRSVFSAVWAKLYKNERVGSLRFNIKVSVSEDNLFIINYLNRIEDIRVLPFCWEKSCSYCYCEPLVNFYDKYQQSVQESVYNVVQLDKAYAALSIRCDEYEVALVRGAYELCRNDLKKNGSQWYRNRDIERIALRSSAHVGKIAYVRTWLIFKFLYIFRPLWLKFL